MVAVVKSRYGPYGHRGAAAIKRQPSSALIGWSADQSEHIQSRFTSPRLTFDHILRTVITIVVVLSVRVNEACLGSCALENRMTIIQR